MSRRVAAMVGTAGLIAIASGVVLADEPSVAAAGLDDIAEISQQLPMLALYPVRAIFRASTRSSDVALRLGMRLGSNYELVLWGEHLLDEDVATIDAVLNLFNDASYQSFMAEPRSYGLTPRVAF